jgi:hypothetical protein
MRWLVAILSAIGAVVGVLLTLAAGTVCVDRFPDSFCGLNVLIWDLSTSAALVSAALLGGIAGGFLGALVAVVRARRAPSA